jgi:hypothetical protein
MLSAAVASQNALYQGLQNINGNTRAEDSASPRLKSIARMAHQAKIWIQLSMLRACLPTSTNQNKQERITSTITEPERLTRKQKKAHASPASRASHCYPANMISLVPLGELQYCSPTTT